MRVQLYNLQLRDLELRQKLPDGHPDLQRIHQQVDAANQILRKEEQAREQFTEGPNRLYEEAQLALLRQEPLLASLQAKADALRRQTSEVRNEQKAVNETSLRVARLEREVALQEANYRKYAENFEQAQIDRALEAERISNISIVQPATYEIEPVRPRLWVNLGLAVFVAVLGSLGMVLFLEQRKEVGEDGIERTNGFAPPPAAVPRLKANSMALPEPGP
jgi:uncharacterized protein involved in exopolysaccharide biosynthesis